MSARPPSELEEAFEVPARALEAGVRLAQEAERSVVSKEPLKAARGYWRTLGPGLTTGAADDDPSGIATYSQAGAQYGFGLIWLSVFTFPFMAVVQEMCARIGLVSGEGLAANIRRHHSATALYVVTGLLFFANGINIAADLGAMAAAVRLLLPHIDALILVLGFGIVSLLLQIFTTYARYASYLKYLTFALLSYVVVAFAVNLDWSEVLYHTFIPTLSFSRDEIFLIVAILGTTISPYLFFWQTSQEVEEGVLHGEDTIVARKHEANPRAIRRMRTDVWSGMFFSNLIMFFIFAACAGTLYASGVTDIVSADQAAQALRPFGSLTYFLFALGIIGTGLLAVPVLAGSSAYAFAEAFKWRYGLYRELGQARAFYGVIIVAMALGMVANLAHIDPIQGLIWAAVANGIIAPIILYFVVRLSGDHRVMGTYANGPWVTILGWTITALMALAGVAVIISYLV